MTDVLGLIGLVVFILCVIGLAAAVTWIVVVISDKGLAPIAAAVTRRPRP